MAGATQFAARVADPVMHPLPGMLSVGPGSPNVFIGKKPAWRGIGGAAAEAFKKAKEASDQAIDKLEKATLAAPDATSKAAAKTAEETGKTLAGTTMTAAAATAAAAGVATSGKPPGTPDIHTCATLLPLPPHGPGFVIDGSKTVMINGLPACRKGDHVLEGLGPPDEIMMGCPTVKIGG